MKWKCIKEDKIVKFIPISKDKNNVQFNLGPIPFNVAEGLWNAIIKQIKKEVKK